MDRTAREQTEYAEQRPVDLERPAYNFSGELFRPKKKNQNLNQIVGAITPENKVVDKPKKRNVNFKNMFWPDDNEDQNPTNKYAISEERKNEKYTVDKVRLGPHQIDILDEREVFKFSDYQDETPEATRPRNFNDFFN